MKTLSEANNAKFLVQSSTDGLVWKELATVLSKAEHGNSASLLNYSFAMNLDVMALAGLGFFGLLLLPATKNKWLKALMLLLVLSVLVSCAKEEDGLDGWKKTLSGSQSVYIRIAQVDLDGAFSYSEVVKAKR